jgi:hypothetical protein
MDHHGGVNTAKKEEVSSPRGKYQENDTNPHDSWWDQWLLRKSAFPRLQALGVCLLSVI